MHEVVVLSFFFLRVTFTIHGSECCAGTPAQLMMISVLTLKAQEYNHQTVIMNSNENFIQITKPFEKRELSHRHE